VHVYDDGDVELTAIDASPGHNFIDKKSLFFAPSEIADGSLDKELISYGCEPDDVKIAIDYTLKTTVGDSIIVGKL